MVDVPEPSWLTMGDDPGEETACPNPDCGETVDYSMEECSNCGERIAPEDFEPDEPDWDSMPGGADDV